MTDEDDPSEHLVALFAAWWTAPEGTMMEEQLAELFNEQAEREDFDPEELEDDLFERIREEAGKIYLVVPLPPADAGEDETEEDDDE